MKDGIKHQGKKLIRKLGYEIHQIDSVPSQYRENEIATIILCKQFSMTTKVSSAFYSKLCNISSATR